MHRGSAICFLVYSLVVSTIALAVENGEAMYAGGTIQSLPAETVGRLNTSAQDALIFEGPGNRLEVPYASISSFQYSQEVVRHLGVLPAIATGLLRHRQHRHLFRIEFRLENQPPQVAIFEVPKQMPKVLQAVLETRAPQGCRVPSPCGFQCGNCVPALPSVDRKVAHR